MKTKSNFFIRLAGAALLLLAADARSASSATTLVPFGSPWRYLDNGSDQGTAWLHPDFNDSTWGSGPARLGFGGDGELTPLQSGHITYYFRRAFDWPFPPPAGNLQVRLKRDDGAVAYLNGTEVFRSNMPTGRVDYLTPAASLVSGADETNVFLSPVLTGSVLRQGLNVVAVEVHQISLNSSDVGFDLELLGNVPVPASFTVQVPVGYSTFANNYSTGGNTLSEVLPGVADATEILKWNPATRTYSTSTYDGISASWSANFTLSPGEGAWIHSFSPQSLTSLTPQPQLPGSAIRSTPAVRRFVGDRWPVAGTFEDVLGFPPVEGDQVQIYEGSFTALPTVPTQVFTFSNGAWPFPPPLVDPGKAVFVELAAVPPPTISQQPQSQTLDEGGQAFFFVGASSATPVTYQWRKDGAAIPGATASFFGVTNATPSDAGAYSVVVANVAGSVTSSNALLTVRPLLNNRVFINEWLASNVTGLRDEDGDASDWLELFNASESPLDVGGAYLTDNPAQSDPVADSGGHDHSGRRLSGHLCLREKPDGAREFSAVHSGRNDPPLRAGWRHARGLDHLRSANDRHQPGALSGRRPGHLLHESDAGRGE